MALLVVLHRVADYFDTVEAVRALAANDDLWEAIRKSGVQGEPRIEIFE